MEDDKLDHAPRASGRLRVRPLESDMVSWDMLQPYHEEAFAALTDEKMPRDAGASIASGSRPRRLSRPTGKGARERQRDAKRR